MQDLWRIHLGVQGAPVIYRAHLGWEILKKSLSA